MAEGVCLVVRGGVEMRGVLDDGVVADRPVKGGLVEAGLGDAQVPNHHLQRVAGLLLPVNRLYQPARSINVSPLNLSQHCHCRFGHPKSRDQRAYMQGVCMFFCYSKFFISYRARLHMSA